MSSTIASNNEPFPPRLGTTAFQQNLIHKHLRQTEQGLRARLSSILHDAHRALNLYQTLLPPISQADASPFALPLFANARAGAWYVPDAVQLHGETMRTQTCSFKSADGHYGQWTSSLRRPNVNVFRAAVQSGSVAIVDVTRKGKTWPDSFTKTIPIWCAVLNVVAGLTSCICTTPVTSPELCTICIELHLHKDVPPSEYEHIRSRLPHWVRDWQRSGVHLQRLIPSFAEARHKNMKPLRVLWVRPDRPIWEDGLQPSELDFTPVICISASSPVAPGERSYVEPRDVASVCGVEFPAVAVGFPYVQGAGDDEEGWCHGLSPAVFWELRAEFMQIADGCAEGGCAGDVEEKLRNKIAQVAGGPTRDMQRIDTIRSAAALGVPIWGSRIRLSRQRSHSLATFVPFAAEQCACVIVLGAPDPFVESNVPKESDRSLHRRNVHWVPLADRKGKIDYKYGLGRALGPCLSQLRQCCIDQRQEAVICCTDKNGDWSAGLAISWLAWHCSPIALPSDADTSRDEDDEYRITASGYTVDDSRKGAVGDIPKERIQATMLHFLSTYPQFQISRATLKQLNRFFSSPAPSSTVTEVG